MPISSRLTKVDRFLLFAAYFLLVGLVAYGGQWVKDQLNQAHDERCATAEAQLDLVTAVFISFQNVNGANLTDPVARKLIQDSRDKIVESCGSRPPPPIIPPAPTSTSVSVSAVSTTG